MRHGKIIACLGVKPEELEKVACLLNELVFGEFFAFKAITHKSWNLYGPRYSALKPLLCLQAKDCLAICNDLAERVREHGCFVSSLKEIEEKGLPFKELEDLPHIKGVDMKRVVKEEHVIEILCSLHEILAQKFHLAARMAKKEFRCWSVADFLLDKERCHEHMAHQLRAHMDRDCAEYLQLTRMIQEKAESGEKYGLEEKFGRDIGREREKGGKESIQQQSQQQASRGQQVPVK
jgi:DNA-binding ferritin-like protein